ncbi:MOS1T transposase, partial [Pseudoatta argentina]
MQSALSGERFNSYEGIKKWLDEWIASKEPDFFIRGIYYRKGGESCRFRRSIL